MDKKWEFSAPRFIDFTRDIDSQLPCSADYFHKQEPTISEAIAEDSLEVVDDASPESARKRGENLDVLRAPVVSPENAKLTLDESQVPERGSSTSYSTMVRTSTPDPRPKRVLRQLDVSKIHTLNAENIKRNSQTPKRVSGQRKRPLSAHKDTKAPKRVKGLTMPHTPTFMKSRPYRSKLKPTTDELVLKRAAEVRRQRRRRVNAWRTSRNTSQSDSDIPPRSTFTMNIAPKIHTMKTRHEKSIAEFTKTLRSNSPRAITLRTTVPITPQFRSRGRQRPANLISTEEREVEETKHQFKANPIRYAASGYTQIQRPSIQPTVVEPFLVSQRCAEMQQRKEQKIQDFINREKKMREFTAKPILIEPGTLPPKIVVEATQPEPFEFQTDARGKVKQQQLQQKVAQEISDENAKKEFHARPVLRSMLVPQLSAKMPTH